MSRRIRPLTTSFLLLAVLLAGTILASPVFAVGSPGCTGCHEVGNPIAVSAGVEVDFAAVPVDKAKCSACHWQPNHFAHASNKERCTCHTFAYPASRDLYLGAVSTPYGYFTSASSPDMDAASLHDIHAQGSWPQGITQTMSGLGACKSCHAPAACSACHDSAAPAHGAHGSSDPANAPVTYLTASGAPSGTARGADTTALLSTACVSPACHSTQKADRGVTTTVVNHTAATVSGSIQRTVDFTTLRAAGAEATFTVSGQGDLVLYSYKYAYGGIARVTVDGGPPVFVDTYSMNGLYNMPATVATALSPGAHTVAVRNTGTRNPLAVGARVNVMSVRMQTPGVDAGFQPACSSCHGAEAGDHAAANHAGSDALVRDYTSNFSVRTSMTWKSYPFGCTPTAASGQNICHDVSSVSSLHETVPGGGCNVCHVSGVAPAGANECLTCHGTGWYNPSTSSGTVTRPGSDYSSSGTVTRIGGSGLDNYSTVSANDGEASLLQLGSTGAEALFGKGVWWLNPNTTTITNLQVVLRAKKLGVATTTSRITVVLDVGGTTYVSAAAATNPSAVAYTQYTYTFATNPKTGLAWTVADLNNPANPNGLRAFGVRQTVSETANIGVTEVFLKVTTPATNYSTPPNSGGQAHHYGNYLRSPQTAAGEWSSAIYTQYCYDRCHVWPNAYAYYGQVIGVPAYNPWNAYAGTQMWSSLMGDPSGVNSPKVRNLTLNAVTLPAGSPVLEFMTNYSLGTGDAGYVEISTDSGANWTTLTGTVGGSPLPSYSGVAGSWLPASYDLSSYAGQTVKLRFRYTNMNGATNAGWCIDNVSISAGGNVIFSDDAETLAPEWDSATHWRRIQYALRWLG